MTEPTITRRTMDLRQEILDLLSEIGPGRMMPTAYDTAWVARLAALGERIGERALDWIRLNQLEDGSWGTSQPYYHHDRAVSTLAAITALAQHGDPHDEPRLAHAQDALQEALEGLDDDPAGETIGFEMIIPTLLNEAHSLGAIDHQGTEVVDHLTPKRSAKLSALPDGMINRHVTLGFSAEMAGADGIQLLDVDNLQEADGSISFSPSATAYYALYVHRGDAKAIEYLRRVTANGSVPNVAPFDIFETAWALWNLNLAGVDGDVQALYEPHLDFLEDAWLPGRGAGFAANYSPKDADGTSVVFEVLDHFGRSVDVDAILHYESPFYFRCFDIESTPSVSANIHVLAGLRQAGLEPSHPAVQKVLYFLKTVRMHRPFWLDKWHASPYYPTTHAIIASTGYVDEMAVEAVDWILSTQEADGSWGYYDLSTAEETAYCLQALAIWSRLNGGVPSDVLERGSQWLKRHLDPPYPPLWIGKCLYCPVLVVRSAVLSALLMANKAVT